MESEKANYAGDVQPTPNAALGAMIGSAAGRQSTKGLLLEHAERLRREAHQLEALAYQVGNISGEAEQMLYRLLSGEIYRR